MVDMERSDEHEEDVFISATLSANASSDAVEAANVQRAHAAIDEQDSKHKMDDDANSFAEEDAPSQSGDEVAGPGQAEHEAWTAASDGSQRRKPAT